MLPMLRPSQGAGLPTLSYPAKYADGIGDVTYAASLPSQNYVPADGSSVKATTYPAYASQFINNRGYHSQKMVDAATIPSADVTLFESAISSDGVYAATTTNSASMGLLLYKLGDTAAVSLTGVNLYTSSTPTGPEGMSFAPNGDYLVAGCSVSPYVCAYRRTPGTDTFVNTPLTIAVSPGAAPACIEVTDDSVAIVSASSGTGYINCYQISTTALTKVGAATFPGSLPSAPLQIVRNKAGTRYAMRFASAPHVRVFDYSGAGNFVDTGFSITLSAAPARITMSVSGDFIAVVDSTTLGTAPGLVAIYKASGASSYAIFKELLQIGGNRWQTSFSPDDLELYTGNTPVNLIVYKPSNGMFSELARGNVGGYAGASFFQLRFSANGKVMMQSITTTPFIAFYTRGQSIVDLPLPAYPTRGSGLSQLNPFIKVK